MLEQTENLKDGVLFPFTDYMLILLSQSRETPRQRWTCHEDNWESPVGCYTMTGQRRIYCNEPLVIDPVV